MFSEGRLLIKTINHCTKIHLFPEKNGTVRRSTQPRPVSLQKLTTQLQTRHYDRHLNTPSTQATQAVQYGQILLFRSIKMGTWGIFRPPEKA